MRTRGFSLAELLLAIFILGIGVVAVAALFPAGIAQSQHSVDSVIGPMVADNALSLLRSRVSQEDFGTLEDFGISQGAFFSQEGLPATISGDWPWLRPGFLLQDDTSTTTIFGNVHSEQGAIDIFSYRYTRGQIGLAESNILKATEFPAGLADLNGNDVLWGIPYNPRRHNFSSPDVEPRAVITQRERYYPIAVSEANLLRPPTPQYVWDCMFRRFQGRVQVAIFIYRVSLSGGEAARYVVPPSVSHSGDVVIPADLPPLPFRRDLTADDIQDAWDSWGVDINDDLDDAWVPAAADPQNYDPRFADHAWQEPGQWILDQNNNVHRVSGTFFDENTNQWVAELLRPVPMAAASPTGFDVYFYGPNPNGPLGAENVATHIWYIPREIQLDLDGDGRPDGAVRLTPVYLTVRDL